MNEQLNQNNFVFPASFSQQRLWFLEQLEGGSPVYNISSGLHITGSLQMPVLMQSLKEIVHRHESLRTTFTIINDESVQVIAAALDVTLREKDLRELSEEEREAEAKRLVMDDARATFDLTRGPLFRFTLLRLGDADSILSWTMHHIISDGWSQGIFLDELTTLYSAFLSGQPSPLPELPIQYADFTHWQREWFAGEVLNKQLGYWTERLEGAPALLELPTDRPRPPVQTFRSARHVFVLPEDVTAGLQALSRDAGVTLFITLLGAFTTLLHRYAGLEDIVIGSPIANRNRQEIEGLIGFFVNTLVLRTDVQGNPTFRELLERVRETALGAYEHQDLPFEKLVEELQPERDLSRNPLFQVVFQLLNVPSTEIKIPGIAIEKLEIFSGMAPFDLSLSMVESGSGFKGRLEYNRDLFDESTIERLARHFQVLLGGIVADPEQRLSELPVLSQQDRRMMLLEWNDTGKEYPKEKCLHELFEVQAERTPDAVAVVFEDQQVSYRELNARANRLARYLRKHGVGPEVLVGIGIERSPEMIVGILGTLKAGGAYVPLDLAYPTERLALMVEDAAVSVLLTRGHVEEFAERDAYVLDVDGDWEEISKESGENPVNVCTPDNVAYMIYTSGSTGRPKGTLVVHRGMVNLSMAQQENFGGTSKSRVLQFASISFDASIFEVCQALSCGASLCLADRSSLLPGPPLIRLFHELAITHVLLPPSVLTALSDEVLPGLNSLIVGGEFCSGDLAKQWAAGHRLFNAYGPTESSVVATVFECTGEYGDPPIGRPISNLQCYVMDRYLNPVPPGVPGELHIGGVGLARGYHNHPDMTAEKFIPCSVDDRSKGSEMRETDSYGARLYRTGDVVRYIPGGNIEFLGRRDFQVKIRGFRIELGEIEAVLGRHPEINEVIAQVHEAGGGRKRLIAYMVPAESMSPQASELRRYLKAKLPDYMIPSVYMTLESLPLTPSGKVDRRALPQPSGTRPELAGVYVAPKRPEEELVAEVWAEVLGLDQVGLHDNFFDLGGHSLLAIRILSRLRETFKVELPLRSLFERPTVVELAESIEALRRGGEALVFPPIRSSESDGGRALSYSQERLWFLEQFEPSRGAYNVTKFIELSGRLDVVAMEQALHEIVRRHEVLRTTFSQDHGVAVEVVREELRLPVREVDLSAVPEARQETEARRLAGMEARRPFDLVRGPLIHATLVRRSELSQVLLLTMHHIVSDAWSMGIFIREFRTLYKRYSTGGPSTLTELPVQYGDFAVWQREWLSTEVLSGQLGYWREQLAELPVMELPTDRPRPPVQTFRGGLHRFEIGREQTEGLRALGRREGTTLTITLLAVFQTLLHRYTGQEDIVVGSPIANRSQREIEDLIGFFLNTLVLRTDLSGDPSFCELLGRVRETALGAYDHQDLPFEKLVEELQPERDLSRNPLFQVMFVFQTAPDEVLSLPGLELDSFEGKGSGMAKFDLTLSMVETASGLKGRLEYNRDLFDGATIERLAGHFQVLLGGIAADPERRLSELPILSQQDRRVQLLEWNDTQKEYPQDKCLHELIEAQVERTPDAVALVYGAQQISYRELNARANQLGNYLRSVGVGPEILVGIGIDRSLEMIVGILGILKAGGAYVPLDLSYPEERLALMLEDAGVLVLLTRGHVEGLAVREVRVVDVDEDWEVISKESGENPVNVCTPDNVAYMIYTSGSTGRPKGVLVAHGGLINLLTAQIESFRVTPWNRVLQFASISFDASVSEIFIALCCGASLCLADRPSLMPGPQLIELIHEQAVTHIKIPPSALSALPDEELPGIRLLASAGESCSGDLARRWASGRRFLNVYGPTESSVCATIREYAGESGNFPIGRPINNVQCYVTDRYLNPVPPGVPGELHIGGVGLARGYLGYPDMTAERFIPNPHSDGLGERIYKTGDVTRYLPDGNIEFLGRRDFQVKVRGFRIELGEIESVLIRHPDIKEVIAKVHDASEGRQQLIAYVVPAKGGSPPAEKLRRYLKAKLPEYMIPSVFMTLESMPLTPSGKVDRRALPQPSDTRPELAGVYVAPKRPEEELVAGIWAEVLGIERVGLHDNFFDLGGHSLLAVRILSRLREAFEVDLPLRSVFEWPSVGELTGRIEALRRGGEAMAYPPIRPTGPGGGRALSYSQERLWFLEQFEPSRGAYNVMRFMEVRGRLDVEAMEQALGEIVRRHEVLRTTFSMEQGAAMEVVREELRLPVRIVDLSAVPKAQQETEARRLAGMEARRPFDLVQGPLIRATLVWRSELLQVLLLTMHHIVSDAWSMGIFIREFRTLYKKYSKGVTSPLTELPVQYDDFAVWQREWMSTEALSGQLEYWREQLAELPVMELPTDRPRPPVQTFRGGLHRFEVGREQTEGLRALGRSEGTTLTMTLLAVFKALLHRYTGQEDIVIGSPIANRNQREIEDLIGFFLNTLVLRTDLSGDPSFRKLLGRVRETALGAYDHQDLPFEKLVEELQPERDLSRNPLFQVMFVFQTAPDEVLSLPGLELETFEGEGPGIAKFDLTLFVTERSDGLAGTLEYNRDLFDRSTIERLAGHLEILLAGTIGNPDDHISSLPLIRPEEKERLLVEWNDTQTGEAKDKCIHELFEARVERTPDAVALIHGDQQVTYRELNARANQLGNYLRSSGVGPDVLVGLCMESCPQMFVGLLGILKAGGACVTLDPAYPSERIQYMLHDTRLNHLLTQKGLSEILPEHDARAIHLDAEWEKIAQEPVVSPANLCAPNNLFYLIYTSGSTGIPKAVTMEHAPLCNLLTWQRGSSAQAEAARTLQYASSSFDVFFQEVFSTWDSGGPLILLGREVRQEPDTLLRILKDEKVERLFLPTVALNTLASVAERLEDIPDSLGAIIAAGEQLQLTPLVTDLLDKWKVDSLHNHYGPSESHVVTAFQMTGDTWRRIALPPIGRPISNTGIYLLDKHHNPVPTGAVGELHIEGANLARGYWGRSDLTAEKFMPNPFGQSKGDRLYSTGDMARYQAAGDIEFLGRMDRQVKIRGFRIELGEIESILSRYESVKECVVTAIENNQGIKNLVAFMVSDESVTSLSLRRYLKNILPDYMIPARFVQLEKIPLTSNGKIDYAKLQSSATRDDLDTSGYLPPRTEMEVKIAAIWREVLEIDTIGLQDNFFDIGGHSLVAVKVIAKIEDQLKIRVTFRDFINQTLGQFAAYCEAKLSDRSNM
jgi:amino acid adenylation domain-containing protein